MCSRFAASLRTIAIDSAVNYYHDHYRAVYICQRLLKRLVERPQQRRTTRPVQPRALALSLVSFLCVQLVILSVEHFVNVRPNSHTVLRFVTADDDEMALIAEAAAGDDSSAADEVSDVPKFGVKLDVDDDDTDGEVASSSSSSSSASSA